MYTIGKASVEEVNESGGASLEGPFKELVTNARDTRCGRVGGGGKGDLDLILSDVVQVSGG